MVGMARHGRGVPEWNDSFCENSAQGNEAIIGYLDFTRGGKVSSPVQSSPFVPRRLDAEANDGMAIQANACSSTCFTTRRTSHEEPAAHCLRCVVSVDNDVVQSDEFMFKIPARLMEPFGNPF